MMVASGDAAFLWAQAPSALPRDMIISILLGDRNQEGPFTRRLKMPPNTTIAPHTHTKDNNVAVLSGSIVHETGKSRNKARGMTLGTGGFVDRPAELPHSHYGLTRPPPKSR